MANAKRICSVDGCENLHYAFNFCRQHYDKAGRKPRKKPPQRPKCPTSFDFIRGLGDCDPVQCVEWPFARNAKGYGWVRRQGRPHLAHRQSLLYWKGDPPTPEHHAAHEPILCHNPSCVNPHHLSWKTPTENEADKILDGTTNRGEQNPNYKLSSADVRKVLAMRDQPLTEIAKAFNVSGDTIYGILNGTRRLRG